MGLHVRVFTGDGYRCDRCEAAWDKGESAPDECVPERDPNTDDMFDRAIPSRPSEHGFGMACGGVPASAAAPVILTREYMVAKDRAIKLGFKDLTERLRNPDSERPAALQGQVGGNWYKRLAIQPTEFCLRNGLDAAIHGTLKYLTRYPEKNGVEDLRKGRHFIEIREAFPNDIRPPRRVAITMLEYVTRNNITGDDASALYALEQYYLSDGWPARTSRLSLLMEEIDGLIKSAS